mgnify:CR=1 FL=1
MSRIGRQPIAVPANVEVTLGEGNAVSVKGPRGSLARTFPPVLSIEREEGTLLVTRPSDEGPVRALHGLSRTLLNNMVVGVTTGFTRTTVLFSFSGGHIERADRHILGRVAHIGITSQVSDNNDFVKRHENFPLG